MKDAMKHSESSPAAGRPVSVVTGVMLAIIYVLYTRLVKGQTGGKRLSVPVAIELIEWLIAWMGRNPAHYNLSQAELIDAQIPSESFLRRLFQLGEKLIVARMNETTLRLAHHIEALLPIKPSCSHALWQLDGQFISRAKLLRYLLAAGYKGKKFFGFHHDLVGSVKSLYVLRVVDVATSLQLGFAVLLLRANQLDVARFLRDVILRWGRPLELRVDLAGEHAAFQLHRFLKDALDIGLQYKDNQSPKLNATVEVLHRIHSVLTAETCVLEEIPLLISVEEELVASVEAYETAARRSDAIYAHRPMVRLKRSPSQMMESYRSVGRQVTPSSMVQVCYCEWTCRVNLHAMSFSVCDLEIRHPHLRFYSLIRARFYPAYEGDRLEVRAVNLEEVLFRCTVN